MLELYSDDFVMGTKEYLLISGAILAALCFLIVYARGLYARIKAQKHRRNVIRQMLRAAQEQNEIFDLKEDAGGDDKRGFSAILLEQRGTSLIMEVLACVSKEWAGTPVVVHFRDLRPEGPIFYQFHSAIQAVESGREKSRLILAEPDDLEVGQKRKFIRIKPRQDAVWSISAWPIDLGKPLPHNAVEVGPPLISYKLGMEGIPPVQVENISSTGMALNFQKEYAEKWPVDLVKGSQILCAVEYLMDLKGELPGTFWCICTVLNSREAAEPAPALILGLEFAYWAMLEKDKNRLHWFRCSPSMGVTHIAQWVMRMDREQHRTL